MSGRTLRQTPWSGAMSHRSFQTCLGLPRWLSSTRLCRTRSRQHTHNNKAADPGKESAATSIAAEEMAAFRLSLAGS